MPRFRFPKRALPAFLLAARALSAQVSGPVLIGPDQYAFQYTPAPALGLFFNATDDRYEFRDAAGLAELWVNPQSRRSVFRGRLGLGGVPPAAELHVAGRSLFGDFAAGHYADLQADGDLVFQGDADFLVPNNRYAFRALANEFYGLFFNGTDRAYEFRDGTGAAPLRIRADDGALITQTFLRLGNGSDATAGNLRWTGTDFEGHDGTAWRSLTAGGGGAFAFASGSGESGSAYRSGTTALGDITDALGHRLRVRQGTAEMAAVRGEAGSPTRTHATGELGVAQRSGLPASPEYVGLLGIKTNSTSSGAAVYGRNESAIGTNYAGYFLADGAGTVNRAVYARAENAALNYAGYFEGQVALRAGSGIDGAVGRGFLNLKSGSRELQVDNNSLQVLDDGFAALPDLYLQPEGDGVVLGAPLRSGGARLEIHGEGSAAIAEGYDALGNRVWRVGGGGGMIVGQPSAGAVATDGLHVAGEARLDGGVVIGDVTGAVSAPGNGLYVRGNMKSNSGLVLGGFSTDEPPTKGLFVVGAVRVGVSDLPSGFKMAVDGPMICEELVVELSADWPDYVFGPDYPLLPLDAFAEWLDRERRLPGMPSAAQREAEGRVGVGETQRLLLEKVEELARYVVILHERLAEQEAELEALRHDR